MRVLILAAVVLGGCFDPDERDGALRCTVDTGCPSGFECRADLRCWRRGTPDDAAPPDRDAPPACVNGVDDDCDGKVDLDDPGCQGELDNNEHGTKKCDDGIDNDNDGQIDFRLASCGPPPGDDNCEKPDDDGE